MIYTIQKFRHIVNQNVKNQQPRRERRGIKLSARIAVDLPTPFDPIQAIFSPFLMEKQISLTAVLISYRGLKRCFTAPFNSTSLTVFRYYLVKPFTSITFIIPSPNRARGPLQSIFAGMDRCIKPAASLRRLLRS